jgi:CHAT domain-containing protein/tetratricopeptide (TPR) repeat protein
MTLRLGIVPRIPSSLVALVVFLAVPPPSACPQIADADSLRRAKQLAWLNNWAEAARMLERMKRSGRLSNDEATMLFSGAVKIRGNIEALSLPSAAKELAAMLSSDAARRDSELRLEILAMKGDVEFQYDIPAAEKTWTEVGQLASSFGRGDWEARAGGDLGTVAFLNGEVFTALKMVAKAYLKAEMYGDVAAQMKLLTALGEGLAEFGRPADATRFFNKALSLSSKNPDAYFPFTAYLGKARLLISTAPQADEGRQMLFAGLDEARREGMRVRETRILTVLGDDAIRIGDHEAAVKWLTTAAAVARSAGLHRIEADAVNKLASVLRDAGDLDRAATYARRSVAAAERAGDVYHLPHRLAALGEIEAGRGDLAAAETAYAHATRLVNLLFTDLPNPRHESTVVATMSRVFQGHFELALNGFHDPGRAFEILESARARGLVDRLRESQITQQTVGPSDPPMLRMIADLNRRLASEPDSLGRGRLLDRLWETELRALRFTREDQEPQCVSAGKPASLRQLQSRLNEGELLVEYALGSARSFAFAVTRDQAVPYELKGRKEIESAVTAHLRAIRGRRDSRLEGGTVYKLLLEPLALIAKNERLIIVPDGKLDMAPLVAAVDPQGRYLIDTHVISYAPSATVFYMLSARPRPRPKRVDMLGVGGASYPSTPSDDVQPQGLVGGLFNPLAPPRFSALRRSSTEVADLASVGWDTRLLTGDNATEENLKRLPLSSYDVLHFALHSAIDRDFPDRSGLVLTSRSNNQDDDLLQAREIMALKLKADLVTLSACDGAAGTPEGIAGTNSLVQAFLMAGARSVVASIWEADDAFTAALMRRFYANLQLGNDKAKALTMAERELLKMYGPNAVPLYWAGFRIVGDAHGII